MVEVHSELINLTEGQIKLQALLDNNREETQGLISGSKQWTSDFKELRSGLEQIGDLACWQEALEADIKNAETVILFRKRDIK